jgi:alanine racemase
MDMVRSGIALYGFWPTGETKMNYLLNYSDGGEDEISKTPSPLRRVMSWKTRIMSIHEVSPGQFIGYGNTCMATARSRIASVPIGYSHGFPRDLSNSGFVLIRGMRAPVTGLVNMNMIMVDVTGIQDAEQGDEVVIIGRQGHQEITVSSFSEMSQYLNYEVLVQIPAHIPRIAVD